MKALSLLRPIALASMLPALSACGNDVVDVSPGSEIPAGAVTLASEEIFSLQNAWSGYEETTRTLILDEEGWAAAWETLHANVSPVPERPSIGFDSHLVVLAAMGTRMTTGYSIEIEEVSVEGGTLYVSLLERSPGSSCGTGQALTAPVHVVRVPREGTTAHFIERSETYSC